MKVTKKHVGLRVRIEQTEFAARRMPLSGVRGVIGRVTGKRFGFMSDHTSGPMRLTVALWRIVEVLPS